MFVAHCLGLHGSETVPTQPVESSVQNEVSVMVERREEVRYRKHGNFVSREGHRLETTCDSGGRSDGAMHQVCGLHHNKIGFTRLWDLCNPLDGAGSCNCQNGCSPRFTSLPCIWRVWSVNDNISHAFRYHTMRVFGTSSFSSS